MNYTNIQKQTIFNIIQAYTYRKNHKRYEGKYNEYVEDMYDLWYYKLHNDFWDDLTFAEQYDLATYC